MEQASPPALYLKHDPKVEREDVNVPLTRGNPPSIEEHRYLEGGTVWKARGLMDKLGLGLPELLAPDLGAESIHFFWEAPTKCGVDSPTAARELLRVQSVLTSVTGALI